MILLNRLGMSGRVNIMVFVDGGYIRKYTKEKYGNDLLAYDTLGRNLAGHIGGHSFSLIRIYYYDAIPNIKDTEKVEAEQREEVEKKIKAKQSEQDTYFKKIHKQEFVTIRLGHLQITPKETPRQKGVDILMSIDMLTGAFEKQYDWAILVAGDSDFLPLVDAVKHLGCNIMGVYFKDHVAEELVNALDRRLELDGLSFEGNNFLLK